MDYAILQLDRSDTCRMVNIVNDNRGYRRTVNEPLLWLVGELL